MRYHPPAWLQVAADGRNGDYYSRLRPEVIEAIPDGCGAVLDVGCGKGTLARWLKENGVAVVRGGQAVRGRGRGGAALAG